MKTLLLATVAALSGIFHVHHHPQRDDMYCMTTQGGGSVVINGNHTVKHDVYLDDGSVLKPDGVVIRKSGYRFLLEDNECIFPDGTVVGDDR